MARVEEVRQVGGGILVLGRIPRGKNIEARGEDFDAGRVIARPGDVLAPAGVSLMMGAGITTLGVFRVARVGILSVGDELVGLKHGRRGRGMVNNYAHLVAGYVRQLGGQPVLLGIAGDSPLELSRSIADKVKNVDVLVTLGRSSVGANDHTPAAISALPGARILFHGVDLLPVRPSGLARVGGRPVCILPAKAVSTALSFFLVAVPVLNLMNGMRADSRPQALTVRVADSLTNKHASGALFLVKLAQDRGGVTAKPLAWGSNLSASLAEASGFIRLAAGQRVRRGGPVKVSLFPLGLHGMEGV